MERATVLVIDDDADIRDAVSGALEDDGYAVVSALGMEALALARESQPEMILLDVMMPGVDGVKLSRLLRANPRTARIPIVAMSALARRSIPVELRYDGWLGKPFEVSELLAMAGTLTGRTAADGGRAPR